MVLWQLLCSGPGLAGWDTWEVEEVASTRWEKLQLIAKPWAVPYIGDLPPSPPPGRSAVVAGSVPDKKTEPLGIQGIRQRSDSQQVAEQGFEPRSSWPKGHTRNRWQETETAMTSGLVVEKGEGEREDSGEQAIQDFASPALGWAELWRYLLNVAELIPTLKLIRIKHDQDFKNVGSLPSPGIIPRFGYRAQHTNRQVQCHRIRKQEEIQREIIPVGSDHTREKKPVAWECEAGLERISRAPALSPAGPAQAPLRCLDEGAAHTLGSRLQNYDLTIFIS